MSKNIITEEKLYRIQSCRFQREERGPWEMGLLLNDGSKGIIDSTGQFAGEIFDWRSTPHVAMDLDILIRDWNKNLSSDQIRWFALRPCAGTDGDYVILGRDQGSWWTWLYTPGTDNYRDGLCFADELEVAWQNYNQR